MSQAEHTIRAAKAVRLWGRDAAMRYCKNRNVPLRLFTLARQLESTKGA